MTEKGPTPLTWEAPEIEIEGRKYKLRRLGLLDIQRIARIYAAASAYIDRTALANINSLSPEALGTFLIDALAHALDEVIDFLASVIGLAPGTEKDYKGTIRDPEIFPLGSELKVIQALVEHEDVLAFFDGVKAMANNPSLKKLMKRLNAQSTESKKGTGGRTKKS